MVRGKGPKDMNEDEKMGEVKKREMREAVCLARSTTRSLPFPTDTQTYHQSRDINDKMEEVKGREGRGEIR